MDLFVILSHFYHKFEEKPVAQSKRQLTPNIVEAALHGPVSPKIPPPRIKFAAPSSPQSNMSVSPTQLNGTHTSTRGVGVSGPIRFPSQQNQFMMPPQPRPPSPGFQSHQVSGQGIPVAGSMSVSQHPASYNLVPGSTDGSRDGISAQVSNRSLNPASKEGIVSISSPITQPKPPETTGFFQSRSSMQDDTASHVGKEESKPLSATGNMFSVAPSQPKQNSTQLAHPSGSISASSSATFTSLTDYSTMKPNDVSQPPAIQAHQPPSTEKKVNQHVLAPNPVGAGNLASAQPQPPWPRMTPSDVQKYSKVFVQVDTDRDGNITGEQARNLFLSWRLPREVLKLIWNLSDQDNDGMLSLREFCIALYLMERFREDRPLPNVLPNSVIDGSLFPSPGQPAAAYGYQQPQVTKNARPLPPDGEIKPPRPVPVPQPDEPVQEKDKVPVLEKHLADQLSTEEQDSLNKNFQEAALHGRQSNMKVDVSPAQLSQFTILPRPQTPNSSLEIPGAGSMSVSQVSNRILSHASQEGIVSVSSPTAQPKTPEIIKLFRSGSSMQNEIASLGSQFGKEESKPFSATDFTLDSSVGVIFSVGPSTPKQNFTSSTATLTTVIDHSTGKLISVPQPPSIQDQQFPSVEKNANQHVLEQKSSSYPVVAGEVASAQSQHPCRRMTQSDVQNYSKVFEQVDTDRDGKLNAEQARNLFFRLKLPQDVLEIVWGLPDQENDNMLTLREFCIALHLMESPVPVVPSSWQPVAAYGQENAEITLLEKHRVGQLDTVEQDSLNTKFQETDKKIWKYGDVIRAGFLGRREFGNGEFLNKDSDQSSQYFDFDAASEREQFWDMDNISQYFDFDAASEREQFWDMNSISHRSSRSTTESLVGGVYRIREEDDFNARLATLANKVEAMELWKVNGVASTSMYTPKVNKNGCSICENMEHSTNLCPMIPIFKEVLRDREANATNTFKKPYQNPYSEEAYNFVPYNSTPKRSLEDTLQRFMESQTMINNQTSEAVNDIRITLTKLTASSSNQGNGG